MKKFLSMLAVLLLSCGWLTQVKAADKKHNALVKISGAKDLNFLQSKKIEIDRESSRFSKNEISIYATAEDLEMLKKSGYTIDLVKDSRSKADRERGYYTYATLTTALQNLQTTYPSLCKLSSIGQTVQGREMWVLKISDNVSTEEAEPEFLYSSTMHGDEVTGMELMMKMANELLAKYQANNDTMQYLVNNTQIYIIPDFNPDGTALDQRENANNVDLNRNFPERANNDANTTAGRAIETQNMMNWTKNRFFVLGGNFHGGAEVVNYPWDSGPSQVYNASPDDANYIWLSRSYVDRNTSMNVYNSEYNPGYGITNGAAWYSVEGGMQDWLYHYHNQVHITIELSNVMWPSFSEIAGYWTKNRSALYWFMMATHKGVKGIVSNQTTGNPVAATVRVNGIDKDFYSRPNLGNYHQILKPGTYSLTFSAEGYQSKTVNNVVVTDPAGTIATATVLNVQLVPLADVQAPVVTSVSDTTATLGMPLVLKAQISEINQISYVKAQYTVNGVTNTLDMNVIVKDKGVYSYSCSIPAQDQAVTGTVKILTKDNLNNEGQSSVHQISWKAQPVFILSENFEATWAPTGWTTAGTTTSSYNWKRDDGHGSGGLYAPTGANNTSHSARFDSYYAPDNTTGELITKTFNLAPGYNYGLSFYYINKSNSSGNSDKMEVFLSKDNGSTWGAVLNSYATEDAWKKCEISLGSTNSAISCKLKFKATSDYGNTDIGLDEVNVETTSSDIEVDKGVRNILLASNYPNPFNPETVINFNLQSDALINISVFNIKGELVSTLINGNQTAGIHSVKFDGSKLNSGVYLYRLSAGNESVTGKMMLLK